MRFLGNSFEDRFSDLKSNYSFAIGDDATTVDVKFTEAGLKELVASLPSAKTKVVKRGVQYYGTVPSGGGEEFLLLFVDSRSPIVHIQYGHE